jgi:hypothetical protein
MPLSCWKYIHSSGLEYRAISIAALLLVLLPLVLRSRHLSFSPGRLCWHALRQCASLYSGNQLLERFRERAHEDNRLLLARASSSVSVKWRFYPGGEWESREDFWIQDHGFWFCGCCGGITWWCVPTFAIDKSFPEHYVESIANAEMAFHVKHRGYGDAT